MKVQNDLFDYGMQIFQNTDSFKLSIDSILIAEFAKVEKNDKIIDLCTGNAAIPLILSSKYENKIVGIELQKDIFDLAYESVFYNNKEKQIKLINDNVKNIFNYFPGNNFDVVICNPPYFKYLETSHVNTSLTKKIARHEVEIDLGNIFEIASKLLNHKKRFYLVHLSERIEEIILLSNKCNLIVKQIQPIYPKYVKNSNICLFEFVKKANSGVKLLSPLDLSLCKTYQNIFNEK